MIKRIIASILLTVLSLQFSYAISRLDSLLVILDESLRNEPEYVREKENHISQLKYKLRNSSDSIEEVYFLTKNIAEEYEVYQCDSALFYTSAAVLVAEES